MMDILFCYPINEKPCVLLTVIVELGLVFPPSAPPAAAVMQAKEAPQLTCYSPQHLPLCFFQSGLHQASA